MNNNFELPQVTFDKSIVGDKTATLEREFIITNGIGGWASAALNGAHTRRYHGLLVAATQPPQARTVLLGKLEERVKLNNQNYALDVNEWQGGYASLEGLNYLEQIIFNGTIPTFYYHCGEGRLTKTIWLEYGLNTTYIRYHNPANQTLTLEIRPLVNYRDYHSTTKAGNDWRFIVQQNLEHLEISAWKDALAWRLAAFDQPLSFYPELDSGWYRGFHLRQETARGLNDQEDMYSIGTLTFTLKPGESVTLTASTESIDTSQKRYPSAYEREINRQQNLLYTAANLLAKTGTYPDMTDLIKRLILAADQFIVGKPDPANAGNLLPDYRTVIAGYHWFTDWGRDTMISFAGLTLATGRYPEAATILRTFARFVDKGMLPNRFPDNLTTDQKLPESEYNTVDATLWYFEAVRRYLQATGNLPLAHELYPILADIISWHTRGTRFNIKLAEDGLLYSGRADIQLTWMDVKIGDWVVTPRTGKPVEISALWYRACKTMQELAQQLGKPAEATLFGNLAAKAAQAFENSYWYAGGQYFYDCLNPDNSPDPTLRPNQILALAVAPELVSPDKAKAALTKVSEKLAIPLGLRSLSPNDPNYKPTYGGDQFQRDSAYHQGTVWGWLIGGYGTALAHFYPEKATSERLNLLEPFKQHLNEAAIGQVNEIFGAEPPFPPVGCVAQAWSVSHLLELWELL